MAYQSKLIVTQEELVAYRRKVANSNIAMCHGHFNVIHPGHMRFLHHASEHGDRLVVAVLGDRFCLEDAESAFFPQEERALGVAHLSCVDAVLLIDQVMLEDAIDYLRPAAYLMGREFESERRAEVTRYIDAVQHGGGEIFFHSGDIRYFSEGEIFAKSTSSLHESRLGQFLKTCKRLGIKNEMLHAAVELFDRVRMLVIGDSIVDQFIVCDPLGMSAEAPVIVLKELTSRQYIGGAAIVAAHVKSLGAAKCHFMSVTGNDSAGRFIHDDLAIRGVSPHLFVDKERPTTFKIRYMVENQRLFRVSRLDEHYIPAKLEDEIIAKVEALLPQVDGVIISDFVYGVITPKLLDRVRELSRANGVRLFGDLQCSSQIGNVLKFHDFHAILPTEREARIALGDHDSGLERLAMDLLSSTGVKNLMITLGANGFIAYHRRQGDVQSEHFPALNASPVDVAGAGDTLLALVALCGCSNVDFMTTAALGACSCSLAVDHVGNIPLQKEAVGAFLRRIPDLG